MRRKASIIENIDLLTVVLFASMVVLGWLNIYASVYDPSTAFGSLSQGLFDLNNNAGKQLIFVGIAIAVAIVILVIDDKMFDSLAYPIWGFFVLLLILVLLFAREVNGARSWIEIGAFRFQPAEFMKFATALALAKYVSQPSFKMNSLKDITMVGLFIGVPAVLIILQGDTGTALVFTVFILVMFREGMSAFPLIVGVITAVIFLLALLVKEHIYLWAGVEIIAGLVVLFGKKSFKRIALVLITSALVIGMFESVDYAFTNWLKPHQQNRIMVLLNPNVDPLGVGWNVTQSKIAIGSGGVSGKGFLQGTQTTFDFVPEQSTDFIFCTIGEEHGWVGSLMLISLFITLLLRLIYLAERQKWKFVRIYGYSVVSILFFHFSVNIGMTIGLFPVIGIPLPMFSYGGSSLLSFTILLFIFLSLDANRMMRLEH